MVFSGDLLKETYSKFKPEYTCWFDKSTWKYLDKYQVLCLQVQVSTKYFWISKCQVQVSTKYSRFCIKYQVSSTSTLLDPNPAAEVSFVNLPSEECHSTLLMISQHWFRWMAWCRQATSHYLSQCRPKYLSPYGISRPQWVNDRVIITS